MAVAEVKTIIANPAGKRRHKRMGLPRNASLKQKLHFGSARVRAAAKAALKRKRKRKHNPGARAHHRRHNPRRVVHRRKNTARPHTVHHRRKRAAVRKRRHNPGEIIALTTLNPAKGRRKMARHHRRKRASSHAGRRRHHNPARHHAHHYRSRHHRKHNPGQLGGMVRSAVAAGVGFIGSKIAAQAVLGANNTGFMGYFGNAVATGLLSWGTHAFTKNRMDAFMVGVGGVLNILGRIIADNSLLGQYSSQLGMGDYLVANWWTPQRLDGDPFSLTNQAYDMSWMPQQQIPIASAAPPGMGYLPAPIPSVYGNDLY